MKFSPKIEKFSGKFQNEIANSPDTEKLLLSAFHFHWKEFSGFSGKLEIFQGKLSMESYPSYTDRNEAEIQIILTHV